MVKKTTNNKTLHIKLKIEQHELKQDEPH